MSGCLSCKSKLTWREFGFSFFAAIVVVGLIFVGSGFQGATAAYQPDDCLTEEQTATAIKDLKKCYAIYDNGVYDLTTAKKWDITGHVGKHLCGKKYDKETIEAGPHKVEVMKPFYLTKLCNTDGPSYLKTVTATTKINWMRTSSYMALIFFVLNFATCYAMPWASVKEPWKGSRPGRDAKDVFGAFPVTHWHKIWAWLAIFSLSFHGILGFSGVLFGRWY